MHGLEKTITGDMLTPAYRKFSDVIGVQATLELCKAFGGGSVFVPKIKKANDAVRDRDIYAKWLAGCSTAQLARKYGISTRTVLSIVEDQTKAERPATSVASTVSAEQVVLDQIRLIPAYRKFSDVIGAQATLELCNALGGMPVSVPTIDGVLLIVRNREMYKRRLAGCTYRQIAEQYGVAWNTAYLIVRKLEAEAGKQTGETVIIEGEKQS